MRYRVYLSTACIFQLYGYRSGYGPTPRCGAAPLAADRLAMAGTVPGRQETSAREGSGRVPTECLDLRRRADRFRPPPPPRGRACLAGTLAGIADNTRRRRCSGRRSPIRTWGKCRRRGRVRGRKTCSAEQLCHTALHPTLQGGVLVQEVAKWSLANLRGSKKKACLYQCWKVVPHHDAVPKSQGHGAHDWSRDCPSGITGTSPLPRAPRETGESAVPRGRPLAAIRVQAFEPVFQKKIARRLDRQSSEYAAALRSLVVHKFETPKQGEVEYHGKY